MEIILALLWPLPFILPCVARHILPGGSKQSPLFCQKNKSMWSENKLLNQSLWCSWLEKPVSHLLVVCSLWEPLFFLYYLFFSALIDVAQLQCFSLSLALSWTQKKYLPSLALAIQSNSADSRKFLQTGICVWGMTEDAVPL